jgi:hypothetical protein
MGRTIKKLDAVDLTNVKDKSPFDHFLSMYGGYLPSSTSRWCTKKLKLEPFEAYIGNEPTISYVGIRGDEDRDGYISKKQSVQSIFPFRKNIWSEDVNKLILSNSNIDLFTKIAKQIVQPELLDRFLQYASIPLSISFNLKQKLNVLLDINIKCYNLCKCRRIGYTRGITPTPTGGNSTNCLDRRKSCWRTRKIKRN